MTGGPCEGSPASEPPGPGGVARSIGKLQRPALVLVSRGLFATRREL